VADTNSWETVADETPDRIIFDTLGDQFVGTYEGEMLVDLDDGEQGKYLTFRNADGYFCTSAGYKLDQAFQKISVGSLVRLTYVKNVDTGQPTPMKDMKVEVAK
jgi:hypothetical protein